MEPLPCGGARFSSNTMSPWLRRTSIPSGILASSCFATTDMGRPESLARGLRSSPPACTASLVVRSSKARDPDLDLASGQGHINIHSICRTTSIPNHVTIASPSTKLCGHLNWMSWNIDILWSLHSSDMVPFLEGNSKINLRQAVDQVPYCQYQPSVLSSTRKWRRR